MQTRKWSCSNFLGLFKRARVFALSQNLNLSLSLSLINHAISLSPNPISLSLVTASSMRIRGRSLPFPPLISSSDPSPASTISLLAPKMDSRTEQNAGDSAPVKIEQVLHPNVYLLPTISHASSSFSPPSSSSLSPAQVIPSNLHSCLLDLLHHCSFFLRGFSKGANLAQMGTHLVFMSLILILWWDLLFCFCFCFVSVVVEERGSWSREERGWKWKRRWIWKK